MQLTRIESVLRPLDATETRAYGVRIMTTSGAVRGILFTLVCGLAFIALPSAVSAAESVAAQVSTKQVLPQGGSACGLLAVGNVQTHVYDGALHSYEVTLPNAAYVALQGTVGTALVPFHQMTRRIDASGRLHILVSVQTTPLRGSVPVTLTLLSALPGQPVCLSVISFAAIGTGASSTTTPAPAVSQAPASRPVASRPAAEQNAGQGTSSTSGAERAATTSVVSSIVKSSGLGSTVLRACTTAGAALQLWFVLLTIFLILAAAVAITEPPLAERNIYLPGTLIGVPLVLLAGFWLMASECRGAAWVPFVALIVAAAAALWSYRKRPEIANVIQLPPAKSKS